MKQQQEAYQIFAQDDIFFQIRQYQKGIKIHLYSLKSQPKMKKFSNMENFLLQNSLLKFAFKDFTQLTTFMQESTNYSVNLYQKVLYLNLILSAKNYVKQINFPLRLMEEQLDPVSQNQILRKQINYYKSTRRQPTNLKMQDIHIIPTKSNNSQASIHPSSSQVFNNDRKSKSSKKTSKSNICIFKGLEPQNKQIPKEDKQKNKSKEKNRSLSENSKPKNQLKITKKKKIQKLTRFSSQQKFKKQKFKLLNKKQNTKHNQKKTQRKQHSKLKIRGKQQSSDSISKNKKNQQKKDNSVQKNLKESSKIYLGQNNYQIRYTNGYIYKGQLKNNLFNGKGQYKTSRYTLTVNWLNGEPNGQGVIEYTNGASQKGIYGPNYERNGHGQDHYNNGQSYVGNFKNQKKNGYGTYYFQNGDYYKGQWKDDMQHGCGVQFFVNGSKFEGNWVQDQKHGVGVLIRKNERIKQFWNRGQLSKQVLLKKQILEISSQPEED